MVDCYDNDIIFNDPAFGELQGDDAKNMWRMLIQRNKGHIKVSFKNVIANETTGSAQWEAEYIFSQTNRNVINKITTTFEFKDGKITKHTDHFNLWRWTQQALGWKGYLLGWSGFMKNKIQKQTRRLLATYKKKLFYDFVFVPLLVNFVLWENGTSKTNHLL